MAAVRAAPAAPEPAGQGVPSGGAAIELAGVSLAYRDHTVLEGVDLEIRPGEIVAIVGPSGSGKSSLLRTIAGFLEPLDGVVRINGGVVAASGVNIPPERRRIGFVFQHYALWPHMTVRENVAYPWKTRGVRTEERARRAEQLLARMGLDGFGDRSPTTLSGGQQQRVALARGLAGDPRLLLLDEPLSSVDAARRDELQTLIIDAARAQQLTTVVTTHDQREATTLADRVVVLSAGRIAQFATPVELYQHPANAFVARFMGALNVFEATVVDRGNGWLRVTLRDGATEVLAHAGAAGSEAHDETSVAGDRVVLVARPESIRLVAAGAGDQDGTVVRSALVDGRSEVRVEVGSALLHVFETGLPQRETGERAGVVLEHCLVLRGEGARTSG